MKKVYRVLCEVVDNGCTIERYNTYVFANGEEEAERVAVQYWNDKSWNTIASPCFVECICEEAFDVIGTERVY